MSTATRVIIVERQVRYISSLEYYIVSMSDGKYLDVSGYFTSENLLSRAFPTRELAVGKAESLGFEVVT